MFTIAQIILQFLDKSDYTYTVNIWQWFSIRPLGEYNNIGIFKNRYILKLMISVKHLKMFAIVTILTLIILLYFFWIHMRHQESIPILFKLFTDETWLVIECGGLSQLSDTHKLTSNKYMQFYEWISTLPIGHDISWSDAVPIGFSYIRT